MINESVKQSLIDYLDGNLDREALAEVEEILSKDNATRIWFEEYKQVHQLVKQSAELKPSAALRDSFHAALQQEIDLHKPTQVFFTPTIYKVAATLLILIVSGFIFFWINSQWQEKQELAQLRKELQETKSMMMTMMNNDLSASQRMMGVSVANNLPEADQEISKALLKVLNEDPNTNVRLSALEALSKFYTDPYVKQGLIQSLSVQKDPSVQIALIQLLVQVKEESIMPQLKNMIEDQQSIKAVRDEAHTALLKLS